MSGVYVVARCLLARYESRDSAGAGLVEPGLAESPDWSTVPFDVRSSVRRVQLVPFLHQGFDDGRFGFRLGEVGQGPGDVRV